MGCEAMRRCYIHIGLQKTGTSYLQSIFWASREELRTQGVALLPGSKDATFDLMQSLLGRRRKDPERAKRRVLQRLSAEAAAATEERAVISEESLCAATAEQAAELVDALPGFEPHVVVSVRDVARQLPSVWQQKVKAGKDFGLDGFLDDVASRRPTADPFWDYQDLPEVLDRWGSVVPPERVHVVTVPRPGSPPELLLERFCSVVGVQSDRLSAGAADGNTSLGREQVELLRQVNAATEPGLRYQPGFGRTRKFYLAELLATQEGRSTRAPATMMDWCTRVADEQVAPLLEGEYDVVGDPAELIPEPSSFSDAAPGDVPDADVLQSAAAAISQMLADRDTDRTEIRRLRRRVEELSRRPAVSALAARLRTGVRRLSR